MLERMCCKGAMWPVGDSNRPKVLLLADGDLARRSPDLTAYAARNLLDLTAAFEKGLYLIIQ